MQICKHLYILKNRKKLFLLLILSVPFIVGYGQTVASALPADSLQNSPMPAAIVQNADSVIPGNTNTVPSHAADTASTAKSNPDQLDAPIVYSAQDSIVFYSDGRVFLHGNGDIKYKDISLNAEYIRVKMDSSTIFAKGMPDSVGDMMGDPIFGEGDSKYDAKEITYNLKTKKGYVTNAVTQQGEAYIVSEQTKKTEDDLINIGKAMYTTCDNHEHPHFFLGIQRGKVKPGSYIVSGPANIVIADVPLPIVVPFGFFPFNSQYSSGLLMPTFVDELSRGLGLTNGGYYFAFNDYVDLELRGDIFTKGTWRLSGTSSYIRRYKFSGSLGVDYQVYVTGEKEMPDYSQQKNLRINWSHRQDAKANPYRTLSASVNFSTSGYNRTNLHNNFNPAETSQNTKSSSINFSQRFANIPVLSLNGGMQVTQVTRDSTISLSLPNLNVALSRIYPLKRKNAVGKERWYEKIYFSYSGTLANSYNGKEKDIMHSSFSRDWKNGIKHSIPVSASFNLFNFLTVTPYFNYNERWHLRSYDKRFDTSTEQVVVDTISGFNRNFDFNMGVSAQTKLYGYYIPSRAIFGDKVDRIRHVVTPSVGFSYNPDFTDPKWGFYDSYIETSMTGAAPGYREVYYSRFEGTLYGASGQKKGGNINFSLANNLEMKIRNDKDTTGKEPFKKISLIDNLSLSSSYNLMADSLNLSNINAQLRIKLGTSRTLSLSGQFEPYMYAVDNNGRPYKTNEFTWNHGMFPHFLGTSVSHSLNIDNNTFKKWFNKDKDSEQSEAPKTDTESEAEGEPDKSAKRYSSKKNRGDFDDDGYENVKIPWGISVSYSVQYRRATGSDNFNVEKLRYRMEFSHNLQFSGNISLTENWKINGNTSYDFNLKKLTQMNVNVTRNLHCWSLTASFVPFGYYKSYYVKIGVNSSMLADLKLEKRNSHNSNQINWY